MKNFRSYFKWRDFSWHLKFCQNQSSHNWWNRWWTCLIFTCWPLNAIYVYNFKLFKLLLLVKRAVALLPNLPTSPVNHQNWHFQIGWKCTNGHFRFRWRKFYKCFDWNCAIFTDVWRCRQFSWLTSEMRNIWRILASCLLIAAISRAETLDMYRFSGSLITEHFANLHANGAHSNIPSSWKSTWKVSRSKTNSRFYDWQIKIKSKWFRLLQQTIEHFTIICFKN